MAIYLFLKLLKFRYNTTCPNKHGNSVTNSISSLLWISIVIPNFKSHNSILSSRVYLMKTVNGCLDMSPQDEQWIRTSLLCLYTVIFLFYFKYNLIWSKHISIGITILHYLKRRYRIFHWIPMYIGTPCSIKPIEKLSRRHFINSFDDSKSLW